MLLDTQRPPTRVDACDFNALLSRNYNVTINTRNYLLSQSPLPMSYRDLRLVMAHNIPSNIVIFPKGLSTSSSRTLAYSKTQQERKSRHRKKHKNTGVDVYRSLIQSDSRCSILSERDTSNDDMNVLMNSLTADHISPLPTYGFFRPQNLPKIQKYHTHSNNNNQISSGKKKKSYTPSSSSLMRPTPPEMFHRTTPTDQYNEESNGEVITTTMIPSNIPENQTRKQLHIYIP
jgi:hypothetical protein